MKVSNWMNLAPPPRAFKKEFKGPRFYRSRTTSLKDHVTITALGLQHTDSIHEHHTASSHPVKQQTPTLQNHPETDLDLWNPTVGYGFHIQR
jgi:hypothetical protein